MQKSFKKTLALILSIVMIIGVLPMGLSFAAETEGDFTYEIEDGKAVVIGYDGPAAVVVPETLGGKPVVKIGNDPVKGAPFFNSNTDITSVVLPDTVEEIVPGSFYGCTNLETIDLGGATKIGDTAFLGCSKLTTITMDADVTTIEVNAFATDTIKNVNFEGTIAQWNAILASMASGNSVLESATVVYCYGKDCEHDYKVVSDTATCLADGTKKSVCKDCGYEKEEYSYAKGHHFNLESIEESAYITVPTCTTDGLAKLNCKGCGEEFTVWLPARGHKVAEDGWKILTEATCTTDGSKVGECVVCLKWTSEVIPHFGHNEEVILGQNADCINPGYTESRYCTTCETYTVVAETIPALGHSYIRNAEESTDATCTEAGLDYNVCERCSIVQYVPVSKLGHDIVNVGAQAPDCENYGWNAYEKCTRCNYTTYVKLPAKGHTAGAAATCTTAQTCENCEYVYQDALGHDIQIKPGKPATCTEDGIKEGEYCNRCNETLVAQEIIKATGHVSEKLEAVDPTCEEDGLKEGWKCSVCDKILMEQEVISKTGHKKVAIEAIAVTCTTDGYTEGEKCETCNKIFKAPEKITKLSHILIDDEGYPATCTEKGLTSGKKCNRLECNYTEQKEIPVKAHTEEVIEAIAPTCIDMGKTEGIKCSVCDFIIVAPTDVPANGHTRVVMKAVEPTCTESGLTEGAKCSACNKIFVEQNTIKALGHTPGAAATCTSAQICTTCNGIVTDVLPHELEYDMSVTKPATCYSDGYEKASCKNCDYAYGKKLPATGHNVINWTTIGIPTCKAEGKAVGLCINCKYNIEKKLDIVDHKDDDGNKKCDFCDKSLGETTTPDTDTEVDDGKCSCNCHAVGIKGLIYDFILFIQRLFGLNKICKCGEAHY